MGELVAGDLQVAVTESGGVIRLDWKGKSNNREPAKVLAPFFDDVVRRAGEIQAGVQMRFERLEHFNSSTITALIQFIQTCRSRGVRLVIVYDGALKWQRLSFDALKIFEKSDGMLTFKTAGP
jgi:hypothetical protein